ncbi:tetraacyldisaccharide 4'-kinase [Pseudoalteromonas sp. BDTF-M6]|uniref:tetraacyldisaccharide 4'-kinase n=1 Tax=Pseudoalteromonas sp. BDTF-M6 TaxID=2796132 RepID=UPI001BB0C440|nr:tetraacyldisaccharide 4'-kinase [Pseudoalteromonas sp. BDTF-M6]MBS3796766.1 tetraacyldisaccharide 4'-kinase [Pseudoalteromonas sp. BDTF-M6]
MADWQDQSAKESPGFAKRLERAWFRQGDWLAYLMLPLSALFWLLSAFNRVLFRLRLKKTYRAPVPVIVVGNISVGGNGKTPMTIYLAELLKQQGKRVGIITRGYGAQPPYTPYLVDGQCDTQIGGDEPVLLAQRTQCPVVIGGDRGASIEKMMSEHQIDIIISDDGLQHYALARDIELCIVDAERRFGNGLLIPAGPLREGKWRLKTVDLVIFNGEAGPLDAGYQLQPSGMFSVADDTPLEPPFASGVAISAIGNPQRFERSLAELGVELLGHRHFRDHHQYQVVDLPSEAAVYMTEKDAVKCRAFAHRQCYYLRVDAKANEALKQQLHSLLKRKGVI